MMSYVSSLASLLTVKKTVEDVCQNHVHSPGRRVILIAYVQILPCPQFHLSSFPSSAYFSYVSCWEFEGSLAMSGRCDVDLELPVESTFECPLQQPLWSIFPFRPTFRYRIFDCTNIRAYPLSARGGYMGAWWEIRRYECMINDLR
jgi:hypothetical protein